jgi:Amidases related to nicotinamidase
MSTSTALLIIDPQRIYTDPRSELHCADAAETISRINRLTDLANRKGWLIIAVRHVHKADGSDLGRMFDYAGDESGEFNFREDSDEVAYDERLVLPPNATEIVKTRYSAFPGTALDEILKRNNISRVVVVGFMTNFCCESTAREAHDRDYYVDFITDATGTPGTENIGEEEMRSFVADCLAAGIACVFSTENYLRSS